MGTRGSREMTGGDG